MTDLNASCHPTANAQQQQITQRYQQFKARRLALDMTRGKPSPEQLDLSLGLLTCLDEAHFRASDGTDCRNYGGLDGIPEAKALFSEFLEVAPEEIVIGGNSSLNMMYDTILRIMLIGTVEGETPWGRLPEVKFLAPSPGYDRHFFICQSLGLQMIPVPMTETGPDMDRVETLVAKDESIKGIWCVPKYSNPTGVVYSDETVERLSAMPTRARDFKIFWDNAYAHHHLCDDPQPLKNILSACKAAGHGERVFIYGSTSKVSFAGAGVAMVAGSQKNMSFIKKQMGFQSIGPDKLNQLRHVRFFGDMDGIRAHMKKHAAILKPRFDVVQEVLEKELGNNGWAGWSRPRGGYFISIDTLPGCARKVVQMAAEAGVKLTPAGATYPYQNDPEDRNIRIAPSYSPLSDIRPAMELVAICIQLAGLERQMTSA
jgi:DNA-binding transcriptional MocR family regulator